MSPTIETPHTTEQPQAMSGSKDDAKSDTNGISKVDAKEDLKPDVKPTSKDDLKAIPMADLQAKLQSSPNGLTQAEATKRLTQYGPNEIAEKKTNEFLKFLSYFWGPIPWMIEAAVILSGVVRHWMDFFIILLLLASNAVVGFWEEHQAGNAIAALKKRLAVNARVKRDGKWSTAKANELVPGDVIRLRLGDIIPADARLLDGDPVEVDQSALTGEIFAGHGQAWRRGVFRLHPPTGRDRRHGLCHGDEHLLRQDRATGAGGAHRQPLPEGTSLKTLSEILLICKPVVSDSLRQKGEYTEFPVMAVALMQKPK